MPRLPPRLLYRLFPLVGRTSLAIGERCTGSGRLVLGLLVTGMLFGIDLRQTLGYQVASLALALLVLAAIASVRWRPRLAVRRILPDVVTDGTPMRYYVEITNHGTRLESDLVVQDELATPRIDYETFQRGRARHAGRASNVVDRAIGFPRWVEMRRRARGAEIERVPVPALAPGASARVEISTTPARRGWLRFNAVRLLRPDPLGLLRARCRVPLREELLALPRRHPLPRLHLHSQRHYQKGGVSLAHAVGDSQEFASVRDYRPGDPRRHIHWRSFARTGHLIVKEYQDEYFDRHALAIDTHLEEADDALFDALISVAASIAAGERPRDSILDVIFAGTEIVQLSAGRGLGDAAHALHYLAEAQPAAATDFDAFAGLLRERADGLASVILVVGAWDSARERLLRDLAVRGITCACLRVTDDDTVHLPQHVGEQPVFTIRTGHLAGDLARVSIE